MTSPGWSVSDLDAIQARRGTGMNSMADVLTAHQRQNSSGCLCGWSELGKSHPGHQEAELTAAGFGPTREAKAEALSEAAAAKEPNGMFVLGWAGRRWLRDRAAAVRGEA